MTTSLQKSVLHRNYCDHVRLVAAALVFISHHFALQGHQEPISRVGSWGSLGVLIFFSLSGYLVAQSVERDPNIVRFLSRRLLRIVPGLVVNVLFCILIVGGSQSSLPLLDYLGSSQTWNFLRNIGFWPHYELPGVFVSNPFPGSVNPESVSPGARMLGLVCFVGSCPFNLTAWEMTSPNSMALDRRNRELVGDLFGLACNCPTPQPRGQAIFMDP